MSRLSIKLRVTLWYTVLMLCITLLVLGFMLFISDSVVEHDARQRLHSIVDYNAEEVEWDDGEFEIDDDFDFYKDGVYSLVYSDSYSLLGGELPKGFPASCAFASGEARLVEEAGNRFLVYDRYVPVTSRLSVWVRGVLPLEEGESVLSSIIRASFITLPLLVLLAVVGGYLVTRRAFLPIEKMRLAADAISEGRDLSARLDIGPGRDELHKLADTFNGMLARLETSFEAESQFTSDASHELRTPVAVILAQCEFALEQAQTPEEYQETLSVIRRQADKMSRLISQLLTFTRLEQGTDSARPEKINLSALVHALSAEQAILAEGRATLHTDIQEGITAYVDEVLFSRLFNNLVQNAIFHGRERGTIFIRLRAAAGQVSLAVEDDGAGIPAEELPKIWRRFYQANPSRTPDDGGSMGMGLAMVQQIAKMHGGSMQVSSTPGQGSVFTFTFPQK